MYEGDFRQSRRQRLRNAEAAERSLQGEIAREIRRRWRVAYMGDLRQARRDKEMKMRQRSSEEPSRRDGEMRRGEE